MIVPLLDLKAQYNTIKGEIKAAIEDVLETQHFILGPKVTKLEEEIALYSQCKYALGVSSGTDAILLALMALGIGKGDIVITTPYTFFATVGCIARVGATPIFTDIDEESFNISPGKIEELINSMSDEEKKRIKAIIPVHLFGQMADMESIAAICKKYNIKIIEDAAQAIGAECTFNGEIKRAGSIGDIGCFSFFPSKNLGGYGDGGMVVTNDEELHYRMKILRTHGSEPKYYHKFIGGNFRLDEIQAAVLLIKLKHLDRWTKKRQLNAKLYNNYLERLNMDKLSLPKAIFEGKVKDNYHIYNQFCICVNDRNGLKKYLKEKGIGTEIYYPVPMHLQECFNYLGYKDNQYSISQELANNSLALPIYSELSEKEICYISEAILEFYS